MPNPIPDTEERTILGGFLMNGVTFKEDGSELIERPERPGGDAQLWRYMDFPKLVSLLERRALFFVRADKLDDQFEGSLSKPCKKRIEDWAKETGVPDLAFDHVASFLREDRKRSVVSCWHEQDHESEAMWRRYTAGRQGIAVRTDFGSLLASLGLLEGVHYPAMRLGRVAYVDYETEDMRLLGGMLLFHKRKSFDHEREVRLARWFEWKTQAGSGRTDLHADVIDGSGIYWPINLKKLIHEVVVSPLAEDWFEETVNTVVAKLSSVALAVRKSSLADPPDWDRPY